MTNEQHIFNIDIKNLPFLSTFGNLFNLVQNIVYCINIQEISQQILNVKIVRLTTRLAQMKFQSNQVREKLSNQN